jgi:hypothetical protein
MQLYHKQSCPGRWKALERLNEINKKKKEKKSHFELKLFIYRDYDKCIFVPKLKDKFQRISFHSFPRYSRRFIKLSLIV